MEFDSLEAVMQLVHAYPPVSPAVRSATGRPPMPSRFGLRRPGLRGARRRGRRVETIELSTATLRVARQGEGQPLLLLSGLGASLDTWAPLADHLTGFELVSFDPPGLGGSGPVRFPVAMAEMARLAIGLVEVLGYDCVDLLGYSWGGALAQELAHQAPDRVRRMVLCATTCGLGGVPGSVPALAALLNPWRHRSRLYLEHVAPLIYGGAARRNAERLLDCAASGPPGHPPNPVGYAAQLYAIATWTSLPWLQRLSTPTLVIAGDDDHVVPLVNARVLADRIPDCRLHIVEDGGHLVLLDQPDLVTPLISEFLVEPGRRAARLLPWGRRPLVTPCP